MEALLAGLTILVSLLLASRQQKPTAERVTLRLPHKA